MELATRRRFVIGCLLAWMEVDMPIDLLNEKKINDLIINPAIDRLVKEVVTPIVNAVERLEKLGARVDGAVVTTNFKLGPEA
jgi:hypothetical protein